MVSLMTLHSAKGLEFDIVFLPGWEEGLFPSQRSMDELGLAGLEEERRLAYVGLTRARRRAFVSYAANRRIHGQWQSTLPSRFIAELPAEHADSLAEPGLFRAPPGSRKAGRRARSSAGREFEAMRMALARQRAAGSPPRDSRRRRAAAPEDSRRAIASSTRNSATERCARPKAASSPSPSTPPATRWSWTASSRRSEREPRFGA